MRLRPARLLLFALCVTSSGSACATGAETAVHAETTPSPAPPATALPAPPPVDDAPLVTRDMTPPLPAQHDAGSVNRGDLLAVLEAGIPRFLAKLEVDAERVGGRFVGWRLKAYKEPTYERFVLQPGDLIMAVNQHSLERPEQLMQVWEGLAHAGEIVFDIVRGDQPSAVRFVIEDDRLSVTQEAQSRRD